MTNKPRFTDKRDTAIKGWEAASMIAHSLSLAAGAFSQAGGDIDDASVDEYGKDALFVINRLSDALEMFEGQEFDIVKAQIIMLEESFGTESEIPITRRDVPAVG